MKQSVITLRSLRSCDSLCRIIIFSDPDTEIPFSYYSAFQDVGVEWAMLDPFSGRHDRIPHMIRFECERQWLQIHACDLDRVFHCDLFDSFFQVSPFSWIPCEALVFVKEPVKFYECRWNNAWLHSCYGKEAEQILQKPVVNSGSIGGGANEYLAFLSVLTTSPDWTQCQFPSADQPILNWLLWNGKFQEHGIKYEFMDCQSGVFTCQYCSRMGYGFANDGMIVGSDSRPLKYLHQYNRVADMALHVGSLCHVQLDPTGAQHGSRT
jgi:hypothetical protein